MNIVRSNFLGISKALWGRENALPEAVVDIGPNRSLSDGVSRAARHDSVPARPSRISSVLGIPRW